MRQVSLLSLIPVFAFGATACVDASGDRLLRFGPDWVMNGVDWLIVSALLYGLMAILNQGRSNLVVIWIGALLIVWSVVRRSDLAGTDFLVSSIVNSVILIIVVLFHNDIRRNLVRGFSGHHASADSGQYRQAIKEVVNAAAEMARTRTGALIAIERSNSLDHITADAVELRAKISKSLLLAIFVAAGRNPLHDGAVVIQGEQISAAGCFLPLTASPGIHQHLGTRHRAAIGLSEETDAAIVVVSEETGTISLACKGSLIRGLDANQLRERLFTLMRVAEPAAVETEKGPA